MYGAPSNSSCSPWMVTELRKHQIPQNFDTVSLPASSEEAILQDDSAAPSEW